MLYDDAFLLVISGVIASIIMIILEVTGFLDKFVEFIQSLFVDRK